MSNWFKEEFDIQSESLVIAFGSFYLGPAEAYDLYRFDLYESLKAISEDATFKKLYVKDVQFAWWKSRFDGLEGYGPVALKKFLIEEVQKSEATRVLTIGASSGGYGAILFTCLCGFELAVSISPQTYLSEEVIKAYKIDRKLKKLSCEPEETDLKLILNKHSNDVSEYQIYFGRRHRRDAEHAKHLESEKGVKLFPINTARHTVGKYMREKGVTRDVIVNFVN